MFCLKRFFGSASSVPRGQSKTTETTDSTVVSRNMTVAEGYNAPVSTATDIGPASQAGPVVKQLGANIPAIRKYPDKFQGHVVLVTGSGSGIGKVTAHMFATQGATLVLIDIDNEKLKRTAEELESQGTTIIYRKCNLAIETEVDAVIGDVMRHTRTIDVLVHLAGAYPVKGITDHSAVEYGHVMSVNMDSCFYLTRAVLPHMREAGYGRIINTSSGATLTPEAGLGIYAASKAAVAGFTRSTAVEAGPGVTANVVCPGLIFNELTWDNPGSREMLEKSLSRQCVKRFGLPTDVAEMICFLASPESEFITGQLFDISGGATFLH